MPLSDFFALMERWNLMQRTLDARVALQCCVTAMSMGVTRKDGTDLTTADFMPSAAEKHEQTPDEMLAVVKGLVDKYGDSR